MKRLSVAFICVGNSCRSQMAEGFAKHFGNDFLEVYSAGTEPTDSVNPQAIEAMKRAGIDITGQYPKLLEEIPKELDIIITMGCNVKCPFIPCKFREDWGLDDPVGKPNEEFDVIRDKIKRKVIEMIEKIEKREIKFEV